jgi:uncharacterized protein YbcI
MPDKGEEAVSERGAVSAAISTRLVQLHKEFYGKGPTKARTFYHGDVVVVIMRGGFTRVEDTLLQSGRGESVLAQRMAFQAAMEDRFKQAISDATGRQVTAFLSGSHQDPDISAEVFILGPGDPFAGDSHSGDDTESHADLE